MICLSSSVVMLRENDGTQKRFEAEELQSRLILCCLDAGIKDYWLAEDLTNAVENALIYQSETGVIFSESEVNTFIIKILEDAGYPNIADKFRAKSDVISDKCKVDIDSIKDLLRLHFGLLGKDLGQLTEMVINALESLSIKSATSCLVLELGRHYRNAKIAVPVYKHLNMENISNSPWVLQRSEIMALLSSNTTKLINLKLIDIAGVSRIFPSLKLNIRLEVLAEHYGLKPVLTELVLFPYFDEVIDSVNEIITRVNRHFSLKEDKFISGNLPVFLRFSDINSFSKKYLDIKFPSSDKLCKGIAVTFADNLSHHVLLKGFSS